MTQVIVSLIYQLSTFSTEIFYLQETITIIVRGHLVATNNSIKDMLNEIIKYVKYGKAHFLYK